MFTGMRFQIFVQKREHPTRFMLFEFGLEERQRKNGNGRLAMLQRGALHY
jgi:hypothetical protein